MRKRTRKYRIGMDLELKNYSHRDGLVFTIAAGPFKQNKAVKEARIWRREGYLAATYSGWVAIAEPRLRKPQRHHC